MPPVCIVHVITVANTRGEKSNGSNQRLHPLKGGVIALLLCDLDVRTCTMLHWLGLTLLVFVVGPSYSLLVILVFNFCSLNG